MALEAAAEVEEVAAVVAIMEAEVEVVVGPMIHHSSPIQTWTLLPV